MRLKYLFSVLLVVLMQLVWAAEPASVIEEATAKIHSNVPAGVTIASIGPDGDGLEIRGTANANSDVATLMRYLDKEVGSPELQSLHRQDNISTFVLTVKKLKI
jgi:Tfp pilus assembly protein PilN